MKLDCLATLKNIDGTPAMDSSGNPVITGDVYLESLLLKEPGTIGETQLRQFKLSQRIYQATQGENAGMLDITVEEAALIKLQVAKLPHGPLCVGQCLELIDKSGQV